MPRAKFEAARDLIQARRYVEARALLRTIDHPKAAEWLAKLDEIAPELETPSVFSAPIAALPPSPQLRRSSEQLRLHEQSRAPRRRAVANVFLVLLAFAAVGVIVATMILLVSRPATLSSPTVDPLHTPSMDELVETMASTSAVTQAASCDAMGWYNANEILIVDFLDITKVASGTPRASLGPVLIEMQRSFRSFERAEHPDCIQEAWQLLRDGMEGAVNGMQDFAAQSEYMAQAELELAAADLRKAFDAFLKLGVPLDHRTFAAETFLW